MVYQYHADDLVMIRDHKTYTQSEQLVSQLILGHVCQLCLESFPFLLDLDLELLLNDLLAAVFECEHCIWLLHAIQVFRTSTQMQIWCAFASLDLMLNMFGTSGLLGH